jgi:hypothetical protein
MAYGRRHRASVSAIRTWVKELKQTPEGLEVEITYRVPELFFNKLVAGAGFEPATFGL